MVQLTLFSEPKIVSMPFDDERKKELMTLEAIAIEASEHELLRGDELLRYYRDYPTRLKILRSYLGTDGSEDGRDNEKYLIKLGDETIGFLSIWDGWLPVECEYGDPAIEVAFVHPKYRGDEAKIRQEMERILRVAKEYQGW